MRSSIMFAQRDEWDRFRHAGRVFVENERNWQASVARYQAVYERLLRSAQRDGKATFGFSSLRLNRTSIWPMRLNRVGASLRADVVAIRRRISRFGDDLHLDQFVRVQGLLDLCHDAVPEAMLADPDHRLEVVAKTAQVAFLGFGQFHRRRLKKGANYNGMWGRVHGPAAIRCRP